MKSLAITVSMIASIYFSCFAESAQQAAEGNMASIAHPQSRSKTHEARNRDQWEVQRQSQYKCIKALKNSEISPKSPIKDWRVNESTNDVTILVCVNMTNPSDRRGPSNTLYSFRELTFGSNGVLKAISPVVKITNGIGMELKSED